MIVSEPMPITTSKSSALDRALDPSTPWDELLELWVIYPEAMLENPILALQSLTEGKPLHELLPRTQWVSLYVYLSRHEKDGILDRYIPVDRRLGQGLRDWWYSCKGSFIFELSRSHPKLLEDYMACLATDPSQKVREVVAEKVPTSFVDPFLSDPSVEVRLALVKNLTECFYRAGQLWKNPAGYAVGRSDRFFQPFPQVKKQMISVAHKLMKDPAQAVRIKNLNAIYADDSMLEYALRHESESFFETFIVDFCWQHRQDGSGFSEHLFTRLLSKYPVVARGALCRSGLPMKVVWPLTWKHGDEIQAKAWERMNFLWFHSEKQILRGYYKRLKAGQDSSWFEVLATKPNLPCELYEQLWKHGGNVRRALLENPTPPPFLQEEMLKNLSVDKLIPILKRRQSVGLILESARHSDPRLRSAVALLPGKPASELRPKLVKDPDPEVRLAVAEYYCQNSTNHQGRIFRETLSALTRDPSPLARKRIATDYRHTDADKIALANDPDPEVALKALDRFGWQVYRHSLGIFSNPDPLVRREAAKILLEIRPEWQSCNSPRHFCEFETTLINDPDLEVRSLLAADPYTRPQTFRRLLKDQESRVREALIRGFHEARECGSQDDFLNDFNGGENRLLKHPNPWVRACFAEYDRYDKHRLRRLARDHHWFVRAIAATAPALCEFLLKELLHDSNELVRSQAQLRAREESL